MTLPVFLIVGFLLLAAAASALVLRNPVHVALAAAVSFVGLGAFFIVLGAEFVGLVQWMVYVGAIAILIVFVILLTRTEPMESRPGTRPPIGGGLTCLAVLATLVWSLVGSPSLQSMDPPAEAAAPIREIGIQLVENYVVPLQAVALLLTAALIGAVLFVWDEKPEHEDRTEDNA